MNNIDLEFLVEQLHFFPPYMSLLAHMRTLVDNTEEQGCANWGSTRTETEVVTLLQELDLITRQHVVHASTGKVKKEDKNMADEVYRLTHFS